MRKDVIYFILLLLITDIAVLMNIPLLRQSLPFIFFSLVPGYLLIRVTGLKLELLEKSLLSVGLSLSLLIFTGLLLNMTYPLIPRPISLLPVLASLNILIAILLIGYRFRTDGRFTHDFDLKEGILSPALVSFMFPVITVLGSYLMNTYSINMLLLGVLLSIPLYIIFLTLLKERSHHLTYPFALFNIALSLLIMNGLPSNYVIGRDIHIEYYLFRSVLMNGHWVFSGTINDAYNACLSVTLLPAVYRLILNVPASYIFKFYYGFLGAVMPLAVYFISQRVLKDRNMAFYASLLFIFQFSFIYILGWCRQLIALIFFSLAIMVLTSDLKKSYKKLLFIIFMISTVFSHYTTAYVFAILTFMIPPVVWVLKRFSFGKPKRSYFFGASVAVLFFVVIFAWHAQATGASFKDTVTFFERTISSMGNFFSEDMRNNSELSVVGIGIAQIPNLLSTVIHDLIFLLIGIGALSLIFKGRDDVSQEYTAAVMISLGLLASFIILPFVSKGYGGTRLFTQMLVFLAPLFIIGVESLRDILRRKVPYTPLILVLLLILFSSVTYLNYHFAGIPYSYAYDSGGERRYETFIYDSEVTGAKWLSVHGANKTINTDAFGSSRILKGFYTNPKLNIEYFKNKRTGNGYVYLRWTNVNKGLVFLDPPLAAPRFIKGKLKMDNVERIDEYRNILSYKNRIYDNGGVFILGDI